MSPIYIQKVEVNWTKEERGGRQAELRNKLPERLPAKIIDTDDNEVLFHHVWLAGTRPSNDSSEIKKLMNIDQLMDERFVFAE